MIRWSLAAMMGLGIAIGVMVFAGAPLLVRVLLGEGYEAAVPVLRLLSLLPPVVTLGTVLGIQWALPLGHDRVFYGFVGAAAVVNIVGATVLVPVAGTMGMATSVVAAESVVAGGLAWYFGRRSRSQVASLLSVERTEEFAEEGVGYDVSVDQVMPGAGYGDR